jgi:hypothetical protein
MARNAADRDRRALIDRQPLALAFPRHSKSNSVGGDQETEPKMICDLDGTALQLSRDSMIETPTDLLQRWLQRQLAEKPMAWLEEQLAKIEQDSSERNLTIALGMIPRRLGKADLELDPSDLEAAQRARAGWDPRGWSLDVAARVLVLCKLSAGDPDFARRFTDLCQAADVGEAVAFYSGLPLYHGGERLEPQAGEGLRTNMRAEFEAVAHRNPFPRERFDENRWNHMVLKALFIGSRLAPIQGLDERANPALARILCDYAHERWAAGRPVTPELWRCVGPYADDAALADLQLVLTTGNETERKAAALALDGCPAPAARGLLEKAEGLASAIAKRELTWDSLAEELRAVA